MRRLGNIYEQTCSRESLLQAYKDAAKSKRGKRACHQFERRLGANIASLSAMLSDGSYRPKPYYEFVVHEPKRRIIHAPAFRDTVVQHAVYRAVYDHFNKGFIDQSYACRKGMGTHKAADYCQQALRRSHPDSVLLQMDVRKFFYSIDRAILQRLIERQIKDPRMVDLMMMYARMPGEKGIPIGNLLSQLYALIYLNPLDHFIKREIKSRLYCRYVDDFVLFDLDRPRALESQARIEGFLEEKLNLGLSKWQIRATSAGINFVGYRTWRARRFIRKHSMYKFRAAARRGDLPAVVSILGHASKTASAAWLIKYLQEHNHDLYRQLPKIYRQRNNQNPGCAGRLH